MHKYVGKMLVACEESAVVRESFRKRGWDAWSCDLQPSRVPGKHIRGDVLKVLNDGWDLMVGRPPCTRIANSGVRWLHERGLYKDLEDGVAFFLALWNAPIKRIALENPIPHKHALFLLGVRYTQLIQPYQFGHGETKATCLWLKNLPRLHSTNRKIVNGRLQRIADIPPGPDRAKLRSETYTGIGDAMAEQWTRASVSGWLSPVQKVCKGLID